MFKFLLLILFVSLCSFAKTPKNECALHSGNGLEITRVIVERIYPVESYGEEDSVILKTYYSYNKEVRDLMNYIAKDLQGADLYSPIELMQYFDDFEAHVVKGDITVIDYGVGGGNGGVVFLNADGKVLADYFDGDLLYCNPSYRNI